MGQSTDYHTKRANIWRTRFWSAPIVLNDHQKRYEARQSALTSLLRPRFDFDASNEDPAVLKLFFLQPKKRESTSERETTW